VDTCQEPQDACMGWLMCCVMFAVPVHTSCVLHVWCIMQSVCVIQLSASGAADPT
jgi:hypothetical protein